MIFPTLLVQYLKFIQMRFYIDNEEILAVFTAPFIILENTINILKISAGEGIYKRIKNSMD